MDATTRRKLREEGKCFFCKKPWKLDHRCLGKDQIHYIEVMSRDDTDDLDLELEVNVDSSKSYRVFGTLGSMVSSLHEAKKYIKVMGKAED